MVPPKIAAMAILDFSRSDGMMVTLGQPIDAACAATDVARLPVDAQAAVVKPKRRALDSATETTRSLNDPVGLRVSSFNHSSRTPSTLARRVERRGGVQPAPRSTGSPPGSGGTAA